MRRTIKYVLSLQYSVSPLCLPAVVPTVFRFINPFIIKLLLVLCVCVLLPCPGLWYHTNGIYIRTLLPKIKHRPPSPLALQSRHWIAVDRIAKACASFKVARSARSASKTPENPENPTGDRPSPICLSSTLTPELQLAVLCPSSYSSHP